MPQGKKMQTPSKEPGSSSMTHEEEEEMLYDISKLQEQVQQVSLAQKATESKMDGLRKDVEAKIDGLKKGVEAKIDGMDDKMEELKINMNKLLQEMVNKGERVLKETHDENKRNVNHDSIDSNVGSKTHHIPKIDMRKFDGKDPATWILQMEQFFDLNNV
jgi:chromosome segregation ATPase